MVERNAGLEEAWTAMYSAYKRQYPELANQLEQRLQGHLPADWRQLLPRYTESDPAIATRKLSETVLTAICDKIPQLIGGNSKAESRYINTE